MSTKIISKENEIKIHGYETMPNITIPSKELREFKELLGELRLNEGEFCLNLSTLKSTVSESKKFFQSKFKLHKIPYKGRLRCNLETIALTNIDSIDDCLKIYNGLVPEINPFRLPISLSSDNIWQCTVVENATLIENEEFLKRMRISYRQIVLNSQITELTASSYIHEITHTQLTKVKGIIRHYYNSEVLSIFLELLSISEKESPHNLPKLQDALRMTELENDLHRLISYNDDGVIYPKEDLLEASKYSESIAKAYGLFMEYYYGTNALKKYILNSIQNIFDGNLQLEELLDEFELTFESSLSDERLLTFLTR